MNKLKKYGIIFLSCMTLSAATTTVFTANTIIAEAHSGRTDANGGHRDNKNKSGLGSYHYHCNGHPAHLHTNGVCPYAVGGQTDNSSAGNSSTAAAEAPSITYDLMNSYSRVLIQIITTIHIRIFRLRLEQISWHCSRIFIILAWQRDERGARSLM